MLPPPGSVSAWGTEIPWADLKKKKIKICWAKRVELQCSHQKKKKDNYVRCKGYVNEGDFHIMYAYQITMLYTLNIILFIKYMSIKLGGLRNDFFLLRLWSSSFHPERSCFLLHLGTPSAPSRPPGSLGSQPQKEAQREELSVLWPVPFLMPEITSVLLVLRWAVVHRVSTLCQMLGMCQETGERKAKQNCHRVKHNKEVWVEWILCHGEKKRIGWGR